MRHVDPPSARQTPPPDDGGDEERVELLFDAFLAGLEEGGDDDIESFAARHPDDAAALRALWDDWSDLDARLDTALPEPLEESFFRVPAGVTDDRVGSIEVREGQLLGDYRLVRRIGQGGMGQVWEAEQLSLQRRVALKLIRPGRGGAEAVARFAREAATAGRVEHPGLVSVYAAGEIDGIPFLAQQLVGDGFDLSDYIGRLRDAPTITGGDYRRIAGLFVRVARACHAAHEAGILHRDLKPQNILIGPDDTPHVTDFGLAHVDGGDDPARPGLVGTWPYMSPEQAAGDGIEIDGRSDVFSLGAVLYEVLALRRAFEGDSGPQVLERVLEHEPPDPRSIRSRVPADLALICRAALAKNRANRYASMAGFADDLERFLRNEPIHARPPGPLAVAVKWVARHPAWSTAIGLSAAALVVISSLLAREVDLRREAEQLRDQADASATASRHNAGLAERRAAQLEDEAYKSNVRAADMHLRRGRYAEALAQLAAAVPARRGWEWHHASLRADSTTLALRMDAGPPASVAVAPGGLALAVGLPDGSIRTFGADGAPALQLPGHAGPVLALAISADGRRLASGGDDGSVRLWSLPDGAPLARWDGHEQRVTAVSLSADGGLVASGSDDRSVRLWGLEEPRVLTRFGAGVVSMTLTSDGSLLAVGSRYGTVQVFEVPSGEVDLTVTLYEEGHEHVALSADGRRLVTGDGDGLLTLWDAELALPLARLKAHAYEVSAVAIDRTGTLVTSTSADDGSLRLWRIGGLPSADHAARLAEWAAKKEVWDTERARRDRLAAALEAKSLGVTDDAPAPAEGDVADDAVAAADADGSPPAESEPEPIDPVELAAFATLKPQEPPPEPPEAVEFTATHPTVTTLTGAVGRIEALALDIEGALVAAGCADGRLVAWDGATAQADLELLHGERLTTLAADADGATLLLASLYDPVVAVHDGVSGERLTLLEGHTLGITGASLDSAGGRAATVSLDGTLRTWDVAGGALEQTLTLHDTRYTAVDLLASGERMLAGGGDGVVRMLDARTGEELRALPRHRTEVVSVAASADGGCLAAAYRDGDVRVWYGAGDREGRWLRAGGDRDGGVVTVSSDGQRVAWGCVARDTVRVWNAATAQPLSSLRGQSGVTAVALSPDGRRVLSASWRDPTLVVWDADTGAELALLSGHTDTIEAVLMTADGGRVVSADRDGRVRVWESRIDQARALWRAAARREESATTP